MLAASGFGSFYLWQKIKDQKQKEEFRKLRNEHYIDSFKLALYDYNYYAPGWRYNAEKRAQASQRIVLLKLWMQLEGYDGEAIDMLYTQATKQFLNIK